MSKLEKLSSWLEQNGFPEECREVAIIARASSKIVHTIRSNETLSGIAAKYKVTVSAIQAANKMGSKTSIIAGQTIAIPKDSATDEQIVAMTLLGEGGTMFGEKIMKEVFTVIKNRAECRGMSMKDIVLESSQFSYWNSRSPDTVLYSDHGKKHRLFEVAEKIVKDNITSSEVGGATHYYLKAELVNKKYRNYDEKPHWADEDNESAKWTEIYRGEQHIYGIDRSNRRYKNCTI
tara:strand:- start:1249 stop:1950 length:702 start_codon:yes stop_codon:yes gene_type:complete